ncbi:hypothetical protein [Planococcus lenghuensis]|uniref:PepSY domain-containing protein n=1 Tax=Planococcus lenghuensis TaxID=2213202 RepID=A0A1Q2KZ89_9BACL|nr:hypothetical protein [Planococcus lenghuensis]AQQ53483.1 hypothetical protein B0X71_10630 [Planococcus lenghuensis]
MNSKLKLFLPLMASLTLVAGCGAEQPIEEMAETTEETAAAADGFQEAREAAWLYVQEEEEWTEALEPKDRQTAEVSEVVASKYDEYTDKNFTGDEVLLVTFEREDIIAAKHVLVDPETNTVVGEMEGA